MRSSLTYVYLWSGHCVLKYYKHWELYRLTCCQCQKPDHARTSTFVKRQVTTCFCTPCNTFFLCYQQPDNILLLWLWPWGKNNPKHVANSGAQHHEINCIHFQSLPIVLQSTAIHCLSPQTWELMCRSLLTLNRKLLLLHIIWSA